MDVARASIALSMSSLSKEEASVMTCEAPIKRTAVGGRAWIDIWYYYDKMAPGHHGKNDQDINELFKVRITRKSVVMKRH